MSLAACWQVFFKKPRVYTNPLWPKASCLPFVHFSTVTDLRAEVLHDVFHLEKIIWSRLDGLYFPHHLWFDWFHVHQIHSFISSHVYTKHYFEWNSNFSSVVRLFELTTSLVLSETKGFWILVSKRRFRRNSRRMKSKTNNSYKSENGVFLFCLPYFSLEKQTNSILGPNKFLPVCKYQFGSHHQFGRYFQTESNLLRETVLSVKRQT